MKKWIRRVAYGFVVIAIAITIYVALRPKRLDVDLAEVRRGPLEITVSEDGRTRIRERYVVSAPLTGRLLRLELDPGDIVVRGRTRLAVITPRDPTLLDSRELKQAEMRVKAQEAAFLQTEPAVEQAKVALDFAEREVGRLVQLDQDRATSEENVDRARTEYRVRQEAYRAAITAQRIAKYELELARAALVRTRQDDIGDYSDFEIQSPIDGSILRVFQESSTIVNPGTPLVEVGDPSDLEVVVDVLSVDGVKITSGADVTLQRWGGDRPLAGQVRLVEPSAYTKISSLGVEEQRVNVIIDIRDPPESRPTLGDGFRVEAQIVTWQSDDTLQVASGGLFRVKDEWAVFVAEHDRARQRVVTLGKQNDESAEVLDGLSEGEKIILHPSDKIEEGTLINPRDE